MFQLYIEIVTKVYSNVNAPKDYLKVEVTMNY